MAIFSGKVVTAKFIDPPNNMTIEVLYKESDNVISHVLEVDYTQQDFNDLLQDITLEEIESNTKNIVAQEKNFIYDIIDKEIERRWAAENEKIKAAWDQTWENQADKIKEAYDNAEEYAQEVIAREYQRIEESWEKANEGWQRLDEGWKRLDDMSNTINEAWEAVEKEWKRLDDLSSNINEAWEAVDKETQNIKAAWEAIERESSRVSLAWEEIEKDYGKIESTWEAIRGESIRVQQQWQEIEGESLKVQESWKEIDDGYQALAKAYEEADNYANRERLKKMTEVDEEFKALKKDLAARFNLVGSSNQKLDAKAILNELEKISADKDSVFNFKIVMLENPEILKSKDKTMKLAIRKAKSLDELLSLYYSFKVNNV